MKLQEQISDTCVLKNGAHQIRHDWATREIESFFELPFNDLLFKAHQAFREHFDPNEIQVSQLLNIKTGACSEDCAYCPQSARYDTGLEREELMAVDKVIEAARTAKNQGATRFCMGAAWRSPKDRDMQRVTEMVRGVKELGMETCVTLGMLSDAQTSQLKESGLDYYNHNLDTSREYYSEIITTRNFQDRLDTLERVREAGIHVCSGGIVGMGESVSDRAAFLQELVNLPEHPESVPINMLVQVEGTPLAGLAAIDPIEFVKTIAVARILMPKSRVRLSAGRAEMSDETQALCFFAGANSIFYGEKLLTTENPKADSDMKLFERLGLSMAGSFQEAAEPRMNGCS